MYVLWLHLLCVTIIPFTVLFWLNKTIHTKLSERLVALRRTGHKSLRRRELRLARVSLGIVLLYMLCHSPKLLPTVCEILYKNAKVGQHSEKPIIRHNFLFPVHPQYGGDLSPSPCHQLQSQLPNLLSCKW